MTCIYCGQHIRQTDNGVWRHEWNGSIHCAITGDGVAKP